MADSFPNKPKILRGAFVEYGLSLPPLVVVFQFNPLQLTRNRSVSYSVPNQPTPCPPAGGSPRADGRAAAQVVPSRGRSLRSTHANISDLKKVRESETVDIAEETIGFEIRLDATDKLDDKDAITSQFGIAPQLATLELMVQPKSESVIGQAIGILLGKTKGFSFSEEPKTPVILFIFGRKRVLPVNITSMNITETEFSTDLNPIRATVAVNLTVIEGKNPAYLYTKGMQEVMSLLNLANIADIVNVALPG